MQHASYHSIAVGDEVDVVVMSVSEDEQMIVLGLGEHQSHAWHKVARHRRTGEPIKGIVRQITNFGAFVKLECGLTGLLHISEIAEDFAENVGDVLRIGEEVDVRVIKLDRRSKRIHLSTRAAW